MALTLDRASGVADAVHVRGMTNTKQLIFASKSGSEHNEPNPILVAVRNDISLGADPRGMYQVYLNTLAEVFGWPFATTPEVREHARRVLTGLAAHARPEYTLCAVDGCPFFVERNADADDADPTFPLAAYLHLTRGDAADDAREDHEAVPGESHTLAWWRARGPERVRERFTDAPE